MTIFVQADFLSGMSRFFQEVPTVANEAAAGALNTVATRSGLTKIKRDIEAQVSFPPGYLDSPERLSATRLATSSRLEAVITGRDRATSLARFSPGATPENSRGRRIAVQVKRGRTVLLKRAFLVSLNNGNVGLAVRLKPGETMAHSFSAVQLDNNVYLLYGPSVDQILKTLAPAEAPILLDMVSKEFLRQFTWKAFKT